jgi:Flp pilus assembly pilin Flp
MIRAISGFFRREEGQDLAEYCLLTALVALVAGGILLHLAGGLGGLWTGGSQNLNAAKTTVETNGMSGAQAK